MPRILLAVVASVSLAAATLVTSLSGAVVAAKMVNLQLYHNGWDSAYRNPFGAARTSSTVVLRLRSGPSVTKAAVLVTDASGSLHEQVNMHVTSHGATSEVWSASVPTPAKTDILEYYFRAQSGGTVRWYGDSSAGAGGPGQTYTQQVNVAQYELTVFLKSFQTPSWMTKAVIYQIFPDRFNNGNTKNDPHTGDQHGYITVYFHKNWSDTPQDGPPYSRDFFGGDLQGIIDKLHYLHNLGINVIYLNPIFKAPSDHKYDTGNFLQIDPEFGTLQTFKALVADAKKDGIHILLDGVFEDTGSDSKYFNRYNEYGSGGAYQSQASPYYSWYTFTNWPDQYNSWFGLDSLPLLNNNRSVQNFIFRKPGSVAQYWLSQGTSGWRLDSADTLPMGYWRAFRSIIKKAYPQSVIIGEKNGWTDALPWLMGDQWDGFMNYLFRDPVLQFFAGGNGAQNPQSIGATRFLNSEMRLLVEYPRPAILSSMNLIDSHDVARILNDLNFNQQLLRLVVLYQMTWLGAPTVFYGDETGITGADNNLSRATFPWQHQNTSLENYYTALIHMRLDHAALTSGSVFPLYTSDGKRVVAFLRQWGTQQIIVALNDSNKGQTVKIVVPQFANGTHLTAISPTGAPATVAGGSVTITLPSLSGEVLSAPGA
ncbi:MAG TPA: glycoside hydrolase family 13 protein [Chloroflexota bacterium]|nr:glycoside hydrolase family 13 protein [Chloroflexota bacterium]